jgi:hypothetical protein
MAKNKQDVLIIIRKFISNINNFLKYFIITIVAAIMKPRKIGP